MNWAMSARNLRYNDGMLTSSDDLGLNICQEMKGKTILAHQRRAPLP